MSTRVQHRLILALAVAALLAEPAGAQPDSSAPPPPAPPPTQAVSPPPQPPPLSVAPVMRPAPRDGGRIRPAARAPSAAQPAAQAAPAANSPAASGGTLPPAPSNTARRTHVSPACRDLPVSDPAAASRVAALCEESNAGARGASFALGMLYVSGNGVPQDRVLALSFLRLAVQQGNRIAIPVIASLEGGPRVQVASEADYPSPPASTPLRPLTRAECQSWSIPNASSRREVLATCERAVRGDPQAIFALGELFISGKIVARDENLAVRLLRISAQQGNRSARIRLLILGYPAEAAAVTRGPLPGTMRQSKP